MAMANTMIDHLVYQPLDYINPESLSQEELNYELMIRGFRGVMVMAHLAKTRSLETAQREESRKGATTQMRVTGFVSEYDIVFRTLGEINQHLGLQPSIQGGPLEQIEHRLIHLLNRSRRMLVENEDQRMLRQELMDQVITSLNQWRGISVQHQVPEPQSIVNQALLRTDEASNAQQSIWGRCSIPLMENEMVNIPTIGGAAATFNPTVGSPTAGGNRTVTGGHLLGAASSTRRDQPTNDHSQRGLQVNDEQFNPRGNYLDMSIAAFGKPPVASPFLQNRDGANREQGAALPPIGGQSRLQFRDTFTSHPATSDLLPSLSCPQMPQSQPQTSRSDETEAQLWRTIQELQSQLAQLKQASGRPTASTPESRVPVINLTEQPVSNSVQTQREAESEDTVYRHDSRISRFATRKQISPDRWGFTFSGEENGSKRDTNAQSFLALLEANRVAEGYSKATMLTFINVLLTDMAKIWWINNQRRIPTYDQFLHEFKQEWFPIDFEQTAFIDLCAYKQKEEPVMRFLNAFQTRLNVCNPQPSEEQVVSIIKRNIREEYREFLVIRKPKTFSELRRVCKEKSELESYRVRAPKAVRDEEKPKRSGMDRPRRFACAIDILGVDVESDEESEPTPYEICMIQGGAGGVENQAMNRREFRCFNCDKLGHRWRQCPEKLATPFCMHCGRKGVKITNCPNTDCQNFRERRPRMKAERAEGK